MQSFSKLAATLILLMLFASHEAVASPHPKVPYTVGGNQVGTASKNIISTPGNDPPVAHGTTNFGTQDSHGHRLSRSSSSEDPSSSGILPLPFNVRWVQSSKLARYWLLKTFKCHHGVCPFWGFSSNPSRVSNLVMEWHPVLSVGKKLEFSKYLWR